MYYNKWETVRAILKEAAIVDQSVVKVIKESKMDRKPLMNVEINNSDNPRESSESKESEDADFPDTKAFYKPLGNNITETRKGTIFTSVLTLVSTMIGGGFLSIPFAFQQGGFAVSSMVLFLILATSTYSGFLIINCKKYCVGRVNNMEDIAKAAFGRKGQVVVQLLLVVLLYLGTVAYFFLIADQMAPIVNFAFGHTTIWSSKIIVLTFVVAIVFPISLMKNLTALRYASSLSIFCGLFLCCCVTYRSVKADIGGPVDEKSNKIEWLPVTIRQVFTCISISELTFSCHFNIIPMHNELRIQTRKNKRIIIISSMGIAYAMNFIISYFGYFQFRKYTDQDITRNYDNNDIIATFGRASLCFLLILSTPLFVVPCREALNKMIWHLDSTSSKFLLFISNNQVTGPSKLVYFIENVILVGSCYLLAYIVPQVNMVWGFVGSVCCTIVVYILPPAFYLRLRDHPNHLDFNKLSAYLLLACGVFMLFAGLYQSIMNVVSPVPSLRPDRRLIPPINNTSLSYHFYF